MLTSEQENAIQTIREINAEIDIPQTIDTLRWAVSNLAYEAKHRNSQEDSNIIIDQISTIVDCMSWVCQIHDCANDLDRAERHHKNDKEADHV